VPGDNQRLSPGRLHYLLIGLDPQIVRYLEGARQAPEPIKFIASVVIREFLYLSESSGMIKLMGLQRVVMPPRPAELFQKCAVPDADLSAYREVGVVRSSYPAHELNSTLKNTGLSPSIPSG
jgi:hypothetical protein